MIANNLVINLEVLSKELERSINMVKEYKKFDDKEMALMYQCRVDTLFWVIKIGEQIE